MRIRADVTSPPAQTSRRAVIFSVPPHTRAFSSRASVYHWRSLWRRSWTQLLQFVWNDHLRLSGSPE